MPERVGVVPAAGHARRLQPLGCSKEALPVGGRPLLGHLLDRLAAAGCDAVRVVTRPAKADVVAIARERGADVVLGAPPTVSASIELGLGGVDDDAIVLVGFPDSVWRPADGFARLAVAVEHGADAALGLFRVAEPERSDVVTLGPDGAVVAIDVKPERPASDWIWGCLAARAGALRGIAASEWPGEHLLALAGRRRVVGLRLSSAYLDVGTPDALAAAEAWLARHEPAGGGGVPVAP